MSGHWVVVVVEVEVLATVAVEVAVVGLFWDSLQLVLVSGVRREARRPAASVKVASVKALSE